jgi:hypothetical protein
MDDAAATGIGNGAGVLAVEAIEATGGVVGPCQAAGTATGSFALDWATVGAEFEKKKKPRLMANMPRNERGISFLIIQACRGRIKDWMKRSNASIIEI